MKRLKKSHLNGTPGQCKLVETGVRRRLVSTKAAMLFPDSELPLSGLKGGKPKVGERVVVVAEGTQPTAAGSFWVATEAIALRTLKLPGGGVGILLKGVRRALIRSVTQRGESSYAICDIVEDQNTRMNDSLRVAMRRVKNALNDLAKNSPGLGSDTLARLEGSDEPDMLCNGIAPILSLSIQEKYALLETFGVRRRLKRLLESLKRESDLLKLSTRIHDEVEGDLQEHVRRNYLQEQLRAIKRELNELDGTLGEQEEWEALFDELSIEGPVRAAAEKELERLTTMAPGSPEYSVSHAFLSWIKDLPWASEEPPLPSLRAAKRQLSIDHFGLAKVKDRILDYLAVMLRHGRQKGQILLLVGPPGVGKTSLAHSVAKALKRPFVRVSLGGVKDEAEIRGHRRTYVGSMPGKILQALKQAGSSTPVILLDEIDKIGRDHGQREIEAALLEVLDTNQNHKFTDHFLGVPYDLSRVMFIATANTVDTLSGPLLDRMETIEIPSYTENEKLRIATEYLIPNTMAEMDLAASVLKLTELTLRRIIRHYTHEAGVRQLSRVIMGIGRKVVRAKVEGRKPPSLTGANLQRLLGPPKYLEEPRDRKLPPGVAVGLAYTETGGEILYIEASRTSIPGAGHRLTLTGNLGKVMRESAQAVVSFLVNLERSEGTHISAALRAEIETSQIHVHVPDGGTPKDGPSAGLAILAATTSLFLGVKVPSQVAMTGEITLRGQILAVGGVREKVLAAHRYGKKVVVVPKANAQDLSDVPRDVLKDLKIILVETMDEALEAIGII